jgi:hypothetical protein
MFLSDETTSLQGAIPKLGADKIRELIAVPYGRRTIEQRTQPNAGHAGDGLQRPLRSRFRRRLSTSIDMTSDGKHWP